MEIVRWNRCPHRAGDTGEMVRVTREEALRLIVSLSSQLYQKDCNTDRAEMYDQKGHYFSIAVHEKEVRDGR